MCVFVTFVVGFKVKEERKEAGREDIRGEGGGVWGGIGDLFFIFVSV